MSDRHTVGVAVFGAGRWGVHLIRNFLHHPLSHVAAIADPSAERLEALRNQFSLPSDVVLTSDWRSILSLPQVEAVAIATPANTHYDLIQAALAHRLHVLAEKPLTVDVEEAVALCLLADQQQRQLVVDHTYLFHPGVEAGRLWLQQNASSPPRYGYATRTHLGPIRQDVDALWDLAIHDIAIFNAWLNQEPIQVQAQGTAWLQTAGPSAGLSDLIWATLTYPSGVQVRLHLCWLNPDKQRRLCLLTEAGTLVFDELSPDPLTLCRGQVEAVGRGFNTAYLDPETVAVGASEPLSRVCDHFLTCVVERRPSDISSGWVGVKLVQILAALSQSLTQNGAIVELTPG